MSQFLKMLAARRLLVPSIIGMVLGMAIAALAGWLVYDYSIEAQLLRANPDLLPQQKMLMTFATARGADVFAANCAACHGPAAKGDSTRGIPDLSDADWLYGVGRVSEIQQTVLYGIRAQDRRGHNAADMPAFAQAVPYPREKEMPPLTPDGVHDVVEYLLSRQNKSDDPAAVDRGLAIFKGRGGCWDCHGDDGHGDEAVGAPNLTDTIWLYGDGGPAAIANAIEKGEEGVCPAWVGRLSAAHILEVSLYVYALSHSVGNP